MGRARKIRLGNPRRAIVARPFASSCQCWTVGRMHAMPGGKVACCFQVAPGIFTYSACGKAAKTTFGPRSSLTRAWSIGLSVHETNLPRVFLNNPKGFSSGRVWVMRIGMSWSNGNKPTRPPVDWSWRCSQFSRRAWYSSMLSVSSWKRGVSSAITQSKVCCFMAATHLARRFAATYFAAFKPCTNGWVRNFVPFWSRPTQQRRDRSALHATHSRATRSSQVWVPLLLFRLSVHVWASVAHVGFWHSHVWVTKFQDPGCTVGKPCK